MKNIIIKLASDENILVYANGLTVEECQKFAEACGCEVADAYEIRQNEIQYYIIDERLSIDTPEKVERAKMKIYGTSIL